MSSRALAPKKNDFFLTFMAFLPQMKHYNIALFSIIVQPSLQASYRTFRFIIIARMVAVHYLDIDLFTPIGQRGLSLGKKFFRKNVIFLYNNMVVCQTGP